MPKRQGRPGRYNTGAVSEHRVAWLQTYVGQIILSMYSEGSREDRDDVPSIKAEPGPTVRLNFLKLGRPVYYTLTALTAQELKLFRELFTLAFDLAEPICEMRDEAAQNAYENGDDSFVRNYRQLPRLVVREGAIRENGGSLYERPEDAAEGPGTGDSGEGGLRGVSDELADGEPEEVGPEDDESEAD